MKFVDRPIIRMTKGCPRKDKPFKGESMPYLTGCRICSYNLGASEFIVSCSAIRGEAKENLKDR